jgi:hypothetical protein
MNDEEFEILFLTINKYTDIDSYYKECDFFFLNNIDLQNCYKFVDKKKQVLYDENKFAFEKCHQSPNLKECCKNYAQNNDVAYDICINQNQKNENMSSSQMMNNNVWFYIIIIIIFIFLFSFIIFFYIYKNVYKI